MVINKLKSYIGDMLLSVYDPVCSLQNDRGQVVDPDTGYTIYNQYVGYYYSVLYTYNAKHNPYYRDPSVLRRAISGWDYYNTQITDDGLARIYTFDQYWHDAIDEWGLYYWINSIELLKDALDHSRLAAWNARIDTAMNQVIRHFRQTVAGDRYRHELEVLYTVANHFVWVVLCCYRYAMVRGDQELLTASRTEMERIVAAQPETGSWLECQTQVVMYAEVSICAISLFALYDHNARAQEAVKRNLEFVLATLYPNMSKNECIDGRNRYSRQSSAYTAPGFALYEAGQAYLTQWAQCLENSKMDPELGIARRLQGLAVVADLFAMLPVQTKLIDRDVWSYVPALTRYDKLAASVTRKRDWVVTLCGLKQQVFHNRWILERQNVLSIFHHDAGLLVRGGHSIAQPQLSSFNVVSAGKLYYMPDDASLRDEGQSLMLLYGGKTCELTWKIVDEQRIHVSYRVHGLKDTERAYVHIPLPLAYGEEIRHAGTSMVLGKETFSCDVVGGQPLQYKQWNWRLSADGVLCYPLLPFNSYKQKQEKSFAEAFLILKAELSHECPECELTLYRDC